MPIRPSKRVALGVVDETPDVPSPTSFSPRSRGAREDSPEISLSAKKRKWDGEEPVEDNEGKSGDLGEAASLDNFDVKSGEPKGETSTQDSSKVMTRARAQSASQSEAKGHEEVEMLLAMPKPPQTDMMAAGTGIRQIKVVRAFERAIQDFKEEQYAALQAELKLIPTEAVNHRNRVIDRYNGSEMQIDRGARMIPNVEFLHSPV